MKKEVSRRKFLKYMGATALTAGSLGTASGALGQAKPIPKDPIKIALEDAVAIYNSAY